MEIITGEQIAGFLARFESRRSGVADEVERRVTAILTAVKQEGDAALFEFGKRFDGVDYHRFPLQIAVEELEQAHRSTDPQLLAVIREARDNIRRFHERGMPQSWLTWEQDGVVLGQRVLPLERVGIYVPGGRAAYPSSLLMGAVPAQTAGVKEIVVATPCNTQGKTNALILATAFELGIRHVFRIGGAQAIAALAYGTQSVPRVDKIVGPGNIYVATAKKMLYGQCGIDMVAGPSEVLIIADDSADPCFVAADLLAQAEHDPLASAVLVTDSAVLAEQTAAEIDRQCARLSRKAVVNEALRQYGGIILCRSLEECAEISNRLAPEHLGLHVEKPWELLPLIRHAGAIFLGHYSPEAVGDYWAGPNHVLPTNGSARFFSPLRVEDFVKTSSLVAYSAEALRKHGEKIERFALAEGLDAHAAAVRRRLT
ncbi:MAG: histidinol dehydrogenase [candidate division KSB1 bacterium]|nr:histidinol dehydrogenase [candidate division KSB1 bacterium]